MLLTTFPFFAFFIIVCTLYWTLPKKYQWILILLASYYFVGFFELSFVGVIVITTLINYFAARFIYKSKHKKLYVICTILTNLFVLFIFKYLNFFAISTESLLQKANIEIQIPEFSWLLPLGISFYTLQTIGYLIDVYREKIVPEKHLGYFAAFVCFFPQLSAGPIERADELLPQLKKSHAFNYSQTVSGLKLFAVGLFKKLVIADNLGIVVDRVFGSLPEYKGLSLVAAVIFFSWQIYMDFAGYTDMARGVGRILGFDLVENFNFPYLSTSVRDFWRRWHMSLSRWFKDYLYIPLGGNRKGLARACINGVIVFTLCGLWHGAAWTFVVWGLFHGIVIAWERILGKVVGARIKVPYALTIFYAYTMVCISWVFFRADTLADAFYIFRYSLVGISNFVSPLYIQATLNQMFKQNTLEILLLVVFLLMAFTLEFLFRKISPALYIKKQPIAIRFMMYALFILAIVQLRNVEVRTFIYTRF